MVLSRKEAQKTHKRLRRILKWLLVVVVVWVVVAWIAARALMVSAALNSADAIVVLSGSSTYVERTHKAAELYRQGRAPLVLLTDDHMRGGWSTVLQRKCENSSVGTPWLTVLLPFVNEPFLCATDLHGLRTQI